jgi:IS4 transposase
MSRAKNASKKRSSRRRNKQTNRNANPKQIRDAMNWLVANKSFEDLAFHGNTSWRPMNLIVLTLLWIWSSSKNLTEAFEDARCQSLQLIGKSALTTYQGLAGALQTWTSTFMPLLQARLHELIKQIGGRHLRVGRWVAIAIDGSRTTTPRTVSNERAFCAKNYGKGKTAKYRKKKTKGMRRRKNQKAKPQPQAPQIWITLMWHIGLGVPWCWKLGPSDSSERQHVKDMILSGHFLKNTLFVGDAGFVGYEFWKLILKQGHHLLVRVGGNVRLLENLGFYTEQRKGIVYCWPNAAMSKKLPPLVLRLVKCHLGRKKKACLLTSILDEQKLSHKEIVSLYEQRWGIELEFRGLKQTFERRTLRSRKNERALVEMEWSIFAMTVIELFALKQQMLQKNGTPRNLSFAKSLRAVRRSLQHLCDRPEHLPDFETMLREALVDDYERTGSKAARYKPDKKDKPSCGMPKVSRATAMHRKKLKQLDLQNAA